MAVPICFILIELNVALLPPLNKRLNDAQVEVELHVVLFANWEIPPDGELVVTVPDVDPIVNCGINCTADQLTAPNDPVALRVMSTVVALLSDDAQATCPRLVLVLVESLIREDRKVIVLETSTEVIVELTVVDATPAFVLVPCCTLVPSRILITCQNMSVLPVAEPL